MRLLIQISTKRKKKELIEQEIEEMNEEMINQLQDSDVNRQLIKNLNEEKLSARLKKILIDI